MLYPIPKDNNISKKLEKPDVRCSICDYCSTTPQSDYLRGTTSRSSHRKFFRDSKTLRYICSDCLNPDYVYQESKEQSGEVGTIDPDFDENSIGF